MGHEVDIRKIKLVNLGVLSQLGRGTSAIAATTAHRSLLPQWHIVTQVNIFRGSNPESDDENNFIFRFRLKNNLAWTSHKQQTCYFPGLELLSFTKNMFFGFVLTGTVCTKNVLDIFQAFADK